MSENDSSQEKTEEATPKRKEKAREDGQTPRSKEFSTTAVLLGGAIGLLVFGEMIANSLMRIMKLSFDIAREDMFDPQRMFGLLGSAFYDAFLSLIPIFSVLAIAAIVGPLALGGWLFSAKSLAPKLNRMDPMKGLGRMFSAKSLVELIKSIGKVLVVIGFAYVVLYIYQDSLLGLSRESVQDSIYHSAYLGVIATIIISVSTIFISIIDVPFQVYDHAKKLRMSMQDIKDELKDSEGKPEVKSKIRQLQQQMSQKRMMSAVPDADVIITNPTHFSVALKYDPDTMATPILLAKGVDVLALKIREVAKLHKIEFVESPLLARAVYHTTELDGEIPKGLFVAIAQVLAYVFQLRDYRKGHGERPYLPRKLDIPSDMSHF